MSSLRTPWWRDAVVYQIYPRSFADSNGDGIGDLDGIRSRLDVVRDLGVDAIWMSPVCRSPMRDNGYDVSDYRDIDPLFGDLASFDRLVAEAHDRDLRVLMDWVPNHTSDQHPWFVDSRSSRDSAHRDWYFWRDGTPERPPNNWLSAFGGPAWTWDATTGQWYLHTFLPEQPELNWGNADVREAMHGTLRFWLDRGVDGFRMDVIHLIGKDPALPDAPPDEAHTNRVPYHDYPGTHELLRGIRKVLDDYPGDRMMVGEVNLRETVRISSYYGAGDELHLAFNFLSLEAGWDAERWATLLDTVGRELNPQAWPTWVLSNHDNPRHRTRLGGSETRARAIALLLLTLRGTPFLYAGEELGLEDAVVPPAQALDPVGRDGCRAPIPWTREAPYGWAGEPPPLPFPPEPGERSVEALTNDEDSILALYRRLLRIRRQSPALRAGSVVRQPAPPGVLCFERSHDDGDRRLVLVNFTAQPVHVASRSGCVVDVDSRRGIGGHAFDGAVPPETALLLRPA
jgi:alpha-glucosidase